MATTQQFFERYGVTPPSFVRFCLLPGLLAVKRFECFYRSAIIHTLEIPAWKTRLRALRTVFGLVDAEKIAEKHIKVPFGALGTRQLATFADAFREMDSCRINAEFLVENCLMPALEAFTPALLFYRGRLVDSLRTQDLATRLQALKIAFKIHKAYPSEQDNIQFATYRDIALLALAARRNNRAIHIVRQTQLVYLR